MAPDVANQINFAGWSNDITTEIPNVVHDDLNGYMMTDLTNLNQ